SSQVIKTAQAAWPDFKYKKRARLRYDLHGLYMMGSVGSIAQSRASDFDYWLCHRPGLTTDQLIALEHKSLAITSWAEEVNLEVHFFLMNAAAFKDGEVLHLSEHSSGSAQYHLLLDEFYRTSVLVAGRMPAWWYVPSEHEAQFDKYLEKIEQLKLASRAEMVDFGHIAEIPAEEFFGAALWQLYKAIDSPFKSVLKILVMEAYASQYPHIQPLSLGFKQLVFESQASLDELDPYLMLYRLVEEYLTEKGQFSRLDLVRRCFYLKLNIPLSQPSRLKNWRRDLLATVVNEWGWSKATLQDLDNRKHWKIDRVLRETRFLVRELIQSYQFLSEFAKDKSALINAEDLNTLGRKLYAAFERKAGKIELINPGIAPNLLEDELTILETKLQGNRSAWSLYRGKVTPNDAPSWHPLKRTRTLIELLSWGYLNTLLDSNTHLLVYADNTNVQTRELYELLQSLQNAFPQRADYGKHSADFSVAAKPLEFAVFVNVGVEPLEKLRRQGKQMTSNKTDAL
ncbi:MAG TPA: adenylate cyclase, partial [Gammaproteobacteria bacterium]|nr:adenylate cyclase [Gammaproteobacteria bacterium]